MNDELWSVLGRWGLGLPAWVGTVTSYAAALLAFAWIVDWALRKRVSPAWRIVLYLGVFVRVAMPADWESPLRFEAAPTVPTTEVTEAEVTHDASPVVSLTGVAERLSASQTALEAEDRGDTDFGLGHLFALAYVTVGSVLLVTLIAKRRRLARELRNARPARDRAARLAPGVRILEHDELGPLAFGVLRPVVVLPSALLGELDEDSLACVVAHERAHLERRDPWLGLAVSVATCVAWPIVPVWLAAARIRHLIELAADERAVRETTWRTYGNTLVQLAGRPRVALTVAAGLQLGGFSGLEGRLLALRHRARAPKILQPVATLLVSGLGLACAGTEQDNIETVEERAGYCDALGQRARAFHDQRERTGGAELAAQAVDAYDEYAERCGDDPDYGKMLYYRAELMWAHAVALHDERGEDAARGAFESAHQAFLEALDEPSQHLRDAAVGQLLSKWNAVGLKDELSLETPSDPGFPRSDYSEEERALLTSFDAFQEHVDDPNDTELQRVLFHRTRLAMLHNRFDEAEAAARALLDRSDGTKYHAWTAAMLTDALVIDWTRRTAAATTPEAKVEAGQRLDTWLARVKAMDLYQHEEAAKLRELVPTYEAALAWHRGQVE